MGKRVEPALKEDLQVASLVFRIGCAFAAAAYLGYGAMFLQQGRLMLVGVHVAMLAILAGLALHVRRTGGVRRGAAWLSSILFVQVSVMAWLQAGVHSPALWWVLTVLLIPMLSGLYRHAALLAVLFVAQVFALLWAVRAGVLPPRGPAIVGSGDVQLALAISLVTVLLMVFMAASARWRRGIYDALDASRRDAIAAADAKARFLATMSHEIRTPLNGLIGAADLLRLPSLGPEQRQQLFALQQQSAQTVLALVNDVLDWSKLSARRMTLDAYPIELRALVLEATQVHSVAAFDKGLEITSSCDDDVPREIEGDPVRLRQVLNNLVANAVKFTETGGVHVHVAMLGASGDERVRLRFEVQDSGIGIPPERHGQLFSAFDQGEGDIARRYGGTGLGLAISRELVDLMGGAIGFTSAQGQGSTFWFELPARVLEVAPVAPATTSRMLLLVTATAGLVRHVQCLMHPLGVAVRATSVLPQGLEGGNRPTHVLVDAALAPPAQALEALARSGASVAMCCPLAGPVADPASGVSTLYKPLDGVALKAWLSNAAATAAGSQATPPPKLTGRVLLVEDNPVNQLIASTMLSQLGACAHVVADGGAALDVLARERFDVVLMDLHMPGTDGVTATRELRVRESNARTLRHAVIAMTADTEARGSPRLHEAGFDGYLGKPFVLQQLFDVLRPHLAAAP